MAEYWRELERSGRLSAFDAAAIRKEMISMLRSIVLASPTVKAVRMCVTVNE